MASISPIRGRIYLYLRVLIVTAVISLCSITIRAQQATVTDNATFPNQLSALSVQGADAVDGVGKSFVKFKLTPVLPSGTQGSFVAKATIAFYVSKFDGAGSFNVYRVTNSWAEGSNMVLSPANCP